jgi:hypothetical protein
MEPGTSLTSDVAPGPLFRHDKLDPNRKSFRLLRIIPTLQRLSTDETYTIHCTLVTMYFERRLEGLYDALSYEWGPDEPPFYWIRLNNHYFRVRKNLYSFLRATHSGSRYSEGHSGLLWIDAICIDQDNISERGHQVKQMGEIYSYAGTVLAWLGPYSRKSDKIKAAAEDLLHLGFIAENLTSMENQSVNCEHFVDKAQEILQHGNEAFVSFAEICKMTYWTRMWIFQEILSARNVSLILGPHGFSWEMVKRTLLRTRIFEREVMDSPTMRIVEELSRTHHRNSRRRSICDTVNAFRHGMCLDNRDRVFAILGLVQGGKQFPVTYSSTMEELFCSVVLASYVSVSSRMGSVAEDATQPQLDNFSKRKADLDALVEISGVSTALGISFRALADHLVKIPDLAIDTLFIFRAWRSATTELSDQIIEHKYDVLEDKNSQFLRVELILLVEAGGQQWLSLETLGAAIPDLDKPHTRSPTYTIESTRVEGLIILNDSSLSMPFATLMFLVGAVHKILNLQEDHLRIIKAQGRCSKSISGIDGKTYTLLDLTSLPV